MCARNKKGLSPLIATAILISAAIAGGLMLYQYFTNAMNKYMTGESLVLSITAHDTGTGKTMFFYTIRNAGDKSVNLTDIKVFAGENVFHIISLNNIVLPPGEGISGSDLADAPLSPNLYAVVEYTVNGKTYVSKPVSVTVS